MPARNVDRFASIHKGLRTALFSAARNVAATDPAERGPAAQTLTEVSRLLGFLREHALHEDMQVMPLLLACDPGLAEALSRQHAELEAAQNQLTVLLALLEDGDDALRTQRWADLSSQVHRLVAAHLRHMDAEETLGSAALNAAYDDETLNAVSARIARSIAPDRYLEWLELVLPALNAAERAGMLASLRMLAPPDFMARVAEVGRRRLGAELWTRTMERLGQAA